MGGDRVPAGIDTPVGVGKSVVVIGAGNTAMDCLRVAKRLGVPTVRCVYRRSEAEAPARIEELRHARRRAWSSSSCTTPVEISPTRTGCVRGIVSRTMELGEPDERAAQTRRPARSATSSATR
jgi:glutamate synthase (NADPH/NADH) small chain